MHVYDNPNKLLSQSEKKKLEKQTIFMIPNNWCLYVIKNIYIWKINIQENNNKQVKLTQHFSNS